MVQFRRAYFGPNGPVRNKADWIARKRLIDKKRKQDRTSVEAATSHFQLVPILPTYPTCPSLISSYYHVNSHNFMSSDECGRVYSPFYHYVFRSRDAYDNLMVLFPDAQLGDRNEFLLKHE